MINLKTFFTSFYSFWAFFHGSGSGILADPDPHSAKKSDPDQEKHPETLFFLSNEQAAS